MRLRMYCNNLYVYATSDLCSSSNFVNFQTSEVVTSHLKVKVATSEVWKLTKWELEHRPEVAQTYKLLQYILRRIGHLPMFVKALCDQQSVRIVVCTLLHISPRKKIFFPTQKRFGSRRVQSTRRKLFSSVCFSFVHKVFI